MAVCLHPCPLALQGALASPKEDAINRGDTHGDTVNWTWSGWRYPVMWHGPPIASTLVLRSAR